MQREKELVVATVVLLISTKVFSGGPNPVLQAIPDNTALDLGQFPITGSTGDPRSPGTVTDYSGFTYDPHGHRMLLFGGGHAASSSDALYEFRLDTLTWKELYSPTPFSDMTPTNYNDAHLSWMSPNTPPERPAARHTYDYIVVPGNLDGFLMFRRKGCFIQALGEYYSCNYYSKYDFNTGLWSWIPEGNDPLPTGPGNGTCEYDLVSGKVIAVSKHGIYTYDPLSETSAKAVSFNRQELGYESHLVYFPPNQKMYYFAHTRGDTTPSRVFEVTLDRTDWSNSTVVELKDTIGKPSWPETGWAYDSVNQVIGGGVQNGVIYFFNPLTKQWTSKTMLVDSPDGNSVGTLSYHCIDYDPVDGVFILLAKGSGGRRTWAYRYASTHDDIPPSPPRNLTITVHPPPK